MSNRSHASVMPMRARLQMLLLFLCFLVTGCDHASVINKIASEQEQAFARQQVEHLRARQFEAIEGALDPRIAGPGLRPTLEKMAAMVPVGELRSVQFVGAQKLYKHAGETQLSTSIEYAFADGWLLAHVVVAEKDGKRTITGLNVYPRTRSLAEENRFTLAGKGPVHYFFLAAAIAALGLTLYALVVCIRTRPLRRKWLWIPFILFGIGQFAVNWTTGEVHAQAIYIQLFGASVRAQFGAPWLLGFSVPLGAIAFLLHARKLRQQAPAAGGYAADTSA